MEFSSNKPLSQKYIINDDKPRCINQQMKNSHLKQPIKLNFILLTLCKTNVTKAKKFKTSNANKLLLSDKNH